MSITVREALSLDIFKRAEIVAGASGIDKKVTYVDVLEVPDIDQWVRKDMLLMTTAYVVKDDEAKLVEMVKKLASGGAAALAIKVGRFFDEIPQKVLKIADELKFPIIKLPKDIAYADIINNLLSRILEKQANLIILGDKLHQRLNKMLLTGGGLDAVATTLFEILKKAIFIEDINGNILAEKASIEESSIFNKLIKDRNLFKSKETFKAEKAKLFKNPLGNQVIMPIIVDKKIYGWLTILVLDKKIDDFIYVAAERGAMVAALEIMKEKASFEMNLRLQREFIDDLVVGRFLDESIINYKLHKFGCENLKEVVAFVVKLDNYPENTNKVDPQFFLHDLKAKVLETIKHTISAHKVTSIVTDRNDSYIVLLGRTKTSDFSIGNYNLAENIKSAIKNEFGFFDVAIGIGKTYSKIIDFKKSYEEATQAIKIGKKVWEDKGIYNFKSLGIYNLLFSYQDQNYLKNFCKEYLDPLIKYDSENGTEFTHTLEVYNSCNGNTVKTAKKLYIHRNTLNYRLKKIKEILNLDIDDPEINICINIALKIKNLLDI